MFDGLILPSAPRSRFPQRIELEGLDPINRGLVGWWPLNETGGTVARDISPFRGNATLSNVTPSASSGWGGGRYGRRLNLDGTDDYASVPSNARFSPTTTGAISMAIWASTNVATGWRGAFTRNRDVAGSATFGIWLSGSGNWHFNIGNSSFDTSAAVLNKPTFLCVTFQPNGTVTGYVDGVALGTTSASPTSLSYDLMIGRAGGVSEYFSGSLWNARMWNRALPATEVRRLYRDPWAGTIDPATRLFFAVRSALAPFLGSSASVIGISNSAGAAIAVAGAGQSTIGAGSSTAGAVVVAGASSATVGVTGGIAGSVTYAAAASNVIGALGAAGGAVGVSGALAGIIGIGSAAAGLVAFQAAGTQTIGLASAAVAAISVSASASVTIGIASSGRMLATLDWPSWVPEGRRVAIPMDVRAVSIPTDRRRVAIPGDRRRNPTST